MANGFGSLHVGASGLRGAQNALNVVANNLSNIDTEGYVRQRVAFEDEPYNQFARAAVSVQKSGLGVAIGDVLHSRDVFLDRAFRTENGRQSFYKANYDAAYEVETQIQETNGQQFSEAVRDLYEAFAEFAKDPSSDVNQNLVEQKAQLFLSRAQGVYNGLADYQANLNVKIKDDVDRVNEIGKSITALNHDIQRIEAGGVETAMQLRDIRDQLLDELSSLAKIEYKETYSGIVKVKLEGTDFITENNYFEIGLKYEKDTGFYNPYWKKMSDPVRDDYAYVYDLKRISANTNTDIGEIKGLLLARGNANADYTKLNTSDRVYQEGTLREPALSASVIMNSQAELDKLINTIVTKVNDLLSPTISLGDFMKDPIGGGGTPLEALTGVDEYGNILTFSTSGMSPDTGDRVNDKKVYYNADTLIFDATDPALGSDGKIPTQELFSRDGIERYTKVTLDMPITYHDQTGREHRTNEIYLYNGENFESADVDGIYNEHDLLYSMGNLVINQNVVENPTLIPHEKANGNIDYTMGRAINNLWETNDYFINPSDVTPCTLQNFYTKWIGELSTVESIYKTTSDSLTTTRDSIEASRQQVIGVGSDDELSNMIKYQNAYNASSRYINVVSQMIEHLLTTLS